MADKGQIRKLRTAQNACVRLLSNKRVKEPIADIYIEHKILTINQMIQMGHCKYGHYIMHQKLSKPIQDIVNANGGRKNHKYDTRHKATPNVQKHTGSQFNNSYMCKSIIEYNKLNMYLKIYQKLNPLLCKE